jgi:N-terminal domain of unknown function (DUF4140)
MRFFLVISFVCMLAAPALAAGKTVTLYLDGARVESEAVAAKGYLEVSLPAALLPGSLRVKPVAGTIDRLEIVAVPLPPKRAKELATLTERRNQLEDRLKALTTREEIFTSAAKSQSGKAPRKSKSNPEPLAAIRQGTDYAIAQLEAVYHARRRTENELKSVGKRLEAEKKVGNVGGSIARVWLTGKEGKVNVSYLVADLRWTPCYDFRLKREGEAEVSLRAMLPQLAKGPAIVVVPAALADASSTAAMNVGEEPLPRIALFTLPIEKEQFSASSQPALSFLLRNSSQVKLPAGEAACYRRGEYQGRVQFRGLAPGEAEELVCGR